MIDPTYVTQATTWLVVWAAGGTAARQWLASKADRDRHAAGKSGKASSQ